MEEDLDLTLQDVKEDKKALKKDKEEENPALWWFSANAKDDS